MGGFHSRRVLINRRGGRSQKCSVILDQMRTTLGGPCGIETPAIIERFLRAHACSGKRSIEVGAAHRFFLPNTFREKYGEASDEGVARSGAVNGFHGECWNVFAQILAGEKRTIRAQGYDRALHTRT